MNIIFLFYFLFGYVLFNFVIHSFFLKRKQFTFFSFNSCEYLCFGNNNYGECAINPYTVAPTPTLNPYLTNVKAISMGHDGSFGLALLSKGNLVFFLLKQKTKKIKIMEVLHLLERTWMAN